MRDARGWTACLVSFALALSACNTGPDDPFGDLTPQPGPAPVENNDSDPIEQPVRAYCTPGQRRCLAENSPLSEVCDARGQAWRADVCPDAQVCREQQCVEFTCVPDRPVCAGLDAQAVCAPTGRGVVDLAPCADDQICRGGECVDLCAEAAADSSYIGCEYTAQRLFNIYEVGESGDSATQSPFAIIAANPHRFLDAEVRVERAGGDLAQLIRPITLRPGPLYKFGSAQELESIILDAAGEQPLGTREARVTIPPGAAAVLLLDEAARGPFRVRSSRPIVTYQFSPYCCNFTATNDASLLLPNASLGQRYRVVGYPTMYFEDASTLMTPYLYVAALDQDANITIESPTPLTEEIDYDAVSAQGGLPRTQISTTIAAGSFRVFSIPRTFAAYTEELADLSGAELSSDQPVAVFTGHPCTFVPQDAWACDHLEEQLLPADTLGASYLLPAFQPRNPRARESGEAREGIYWRLVADEDLSATLVPSIEELEIFETSSFATPSCLEFVDDAGQLVMAEGEVCELGLREAAGVEASGSMLVAGVLSGHQSTGLTNYGTEAGDPSLFLTPPAEQFRRDYSFVTPPTFEETYAAIAIPKGVEVTYQGRYIAEDAQLERREVSLAGRRWELFNIQIEAGVHQLRADEPFGLIVYAYDDYVSYAFPGGLDLVPRMKQR